MNLVPLDGLGWLLACLLPFLFVQRWLHQNIHDLFLIVTRRPMMALGFFCLLFFPGVLLHEGSHFLAARLLDVRTGRFSLFPRRLADGRVLLGYVETARSDPLRDTLIGAAPLISGGVAVTLISSQVLGLPELALNPFEYGWSQLWQGLAELLALKDVWLWLYLTLVISSTMMPSRADRRGWLPVLLVLALLTGAALFAGAGAWMAEWLASALNRGLRALALVFGISLGVHLALGVPLWLLRALAGTIINRPRPTATP